MNPPTLTLGSTTITLPHPSSSQAPARDLDVRMVQRRTIGGRLRTTVMSWGHAYSLEFRFVSLATYDAIRDFWLAAVVAGKYPTLDYMGLFASAANVAVSIKLSPATAALTADPSLVNFSLELEEVNPR